MFKILLVEDEMSLALLIKDSLESESYAVKHAPNGQIALDIFQSEEFDLIILDVMMPKVNGFDVSKAIRLTNRDVPILFLTAKVQVKDVVKGFESGANDYIRKPFSMQELIVRMKYLLKDKDLMQNDNSGDNQINRIGAYTFNSRTFVLKTEDEERKLTAKEAHLLEALCNQKNMIVTKEHLLLSVWGDDSFFNSRSLDVFISRLRKYLSKDEAISILNIRGIGYKLIEE